MLPTGDLEEGAFQCCRGLEVHLAQLLDAS